MSSGGSADRAEWESTALDKARERSPERRDAFETSSRIPIQRLYTRDTDLDVSIAAADGDLVLVHEGYHTVAAAPGTNAWYLNFLAGDTKPVVQLNDPAYSWIVDEWTGRPIGIPLAGD